MSNCHKRCIENGNVKKMFIVFMKIIIVFNVQRTYSSNNGGYYLKSYLYCIQLEAKIIYKAKLEFKAVFLQSI